MMKLIKKEIKNMMIKVRAKVKALEDNIENVVYISVRKNVKYRTIKNVDSIRKSKDSECRETDIKYRV